jgi:uncharacterized protein (DUF983 family)
MTDSRAEHKAEPKARPVPLRAGDPAQCPDCGGGQWFIGRHAAECAACGSPLPLADGGPLGAAAARLRVKGRFRRAA